MTDEYRKASQAAAEDFPHNRLASRAFGQFAKNGFGLLPGSQAREDEFRDGYKDTHRAMASDAQRLVNVRPQSSLSGVVPPGSGVRSGGASGGNAMSYAMQMGLLAELKDYLQRFDLGLSDVEIKYRNQMAELDGVLLREDHNLLSFDHMEPTCSGIGRVQAWIVDGSIPALNAQIAHFGGAADAGASASTDQSADLGRSASFGDEQTWQGQVELLYELKAFLWRLEVSFSMFQVRYRQQVMGLADVMRDDHAEFVEHQMEPTLVMIQRLREFIAESSVPAVQRIIEQIETRPHF